MGGWRGAPWALAAEEEGEEERRALRGETMGDWLRYGRVPGPPESPPALPTKQEQHSAATGPGKEDQNDGGERTPGALRIDSGLPHSLCSAVLLPLKPCRFGPHPRLPGPPSHSAVFARLPPSAPPIRHSVTAGKTPRIAAAHSTETTLRSQ